MAVISLEQNVLTCLLDGDVDGAVTILSEMYPGERAVLREAASELMRIADPRYWCAGCGKYISDAKGLAEFWKPDGRWHKDCWFKTGNNHALVEQAYGRHANT